MEYLARRMGRMWFDIFLILALLAIAIKAVMLLHIPAWIGVIVGVAVKFAHSLGMRYYFPPRMPALMIGLMFSQEGDGYGEENEKEPWQQ